MQHTLEGIVLRQYKNGTDRVLHILTASQGVITAYASGAAKPRSSMAASTELLCYCTFVIFQHRDRSIVDKADSLRLFFGIRSDIEKLSLASYLAQLADEVCPHGVEAGEHLRLLLNTLHYIETGKRPPALLKALFELRILTLSGFMPDLVACRCCSRYEAPDMRFFPQQGELICADCLAGQPAAGTGMPVPPGVLAAMRHILYAPPEKLFRFSLSEDGITRLSQVAERYLEYQVDRPLPALDFYRGLMNTPF